MPHYHVNQSIVSLRRFIVESYVTNPNTTYLHHLFNHSINHSHTHTPGVVNGGKICQSYFSDGIVVLWGSLVMANAVETYGLHKRFAVSLLSYTGYYESA